MHPMSVILGEASAAMAAAADVASRESSQPHWWQITTGIIAIPVAIVGLIYSYVLLKKTRLEVLKTELEIREKQQQLGNVKLATESPRAEEVGRAVLEPVLQGRFIQFILLRFVVLYLVLEIWGLVQEVFSFVVTRAAVASTRLFHVNESSLWFIAPLLVLSEVPRIGYWLLFFALGWPLFLDVNRTLGLRVKDVFSIHRHKDDQLRSAQIDSVHSIKP